LREQLYAAKLTRGLASAGPREKGKDVTILELLDYTGVAVFAATGAFFASRRRHTIS